MQQEQAKPLHIILSGFMGSGKTTCANHLSKRLRIPRIDLDQALEEKYRINIATLFEKKGEPAFRVLEFEVLKQILETHADQSLILALGGGAILANQSYELIRPFGTIIYLMATAETLIRRIQMDENGQRPLVKNQNLSKFIPERLESRAALYMNHCDEVLSVDDKTPDQVAEEIIHRLELNAYVSRY